MKSTTTARQRGSALITSMILVMIMTTLVLSLMRLGGNDIRLTRFTSTYKRALAASEAGVDKGMLALRDFVILRGTPSQEELDTVAPPTIEEFSFATPDGRDAFRIYVNGDYHESQVITDGRWAGLVGDYQQYSIVSGVTHDETERGAVVIRTLQRLTIPVFQFGVFYYEDLEINPGPALTFAGPVHTNLDLYISPNNNCTFTSLVTSVGEIWRHRKDDPGAYGGGRVRVNDGDGNYRDMRVDGGWLEHDHADWSSEALMRWKGRMIDSDHVVPKLFIPIPSVDEPHRIIERALDPGDADYDATEEAQKFENKADVKIWADSSGDLHATLGSGSAFDLEYDDGGTTRTVAEINTFGDFREGNPWANQVRTVQSVDIDVAALRDHPDLPEDGVVVYAYNEYEPSGDLPAVRLHNGRRLPAGGMSVASPNPIYIQGHFNDDEDHWVPSLVCGDAVSILSRNWNDSNSWNRRTRDRRAGTTNVKTIVMTGNTDTAVGSYNGGLENVLRFCERWSGQALNFTGAILCMWNAEVATGDWKYGDPVYTAPTRNWGYDVRFRDPSNEPPGIPKVFGLEFLRWERSSWDEIDGMLEST